MLLIEEEHVFFELNIYLSYPLLVVYIILYLYIQLVITDIFQCISFDYIFYI